MSDLTDLTGAQTVKIAGADTSGVEQAYIGNNGNRLLVDSLNTSAVFNYMKSNQLYSAVANVTAATGNADNPIFLLNNPAASGKTVYIYKISAGVAINGVQCEFKAFSMPTISANGTAISVAARFINNSQPAGAAQPFSLPTITSTGASMDNLNIGQNGNTDSFFSDFTIGIAPGGSLLVTAQPSSNNRTVMVTIIWAEV